MEIIKDLKVRQKYNVLKHEKEALLVARRKLDELTKELQAKLHTVWPDENLSTALRELDMKISGIQSVMKRIELLGR